MKQKKLVRDDIQKVRELLDKRKTVKELSTMFDVWESTIETIRDGDAEKVTKSDYPKGHPYHKLDNKIRSFNSKGINLYNIEYTIEDVIAKFGLHPKCYLSGIEFNLLEPDGFHLDHIFPKSMGGPNSLENMEVLSGVLNLFKGWFSISSILGKMAQVLEYQGCTIIRPDKGKLTCQKLLDYDKELRRKYNEGRLQECLFKDTGLDI